MEENRVALNAMYIAASQPSLLPPERKEARRMGEIVVALCTPQPIYVIVEQVFSKPGIPQLFNTVGPELRQVTRKVGQVCADDDVFYKGKRLDRLPSLLEIIIEKLTPGQQITRQPNGKRQLMGVYFGFRNRFRPFSDLSFLPKFVTRERDLGMPPSPYTYGTDPIPEVQLFGNPAVPFTSPGGNGPPSALAIYHQSTRRLEVPPMSAASDRLRELLLTGH